MEIKVPHLGESVSEAVVCALLKEDGAFVKADDELLEIETEKVNQIIYAPSCGRLKYLVKIGENYTLLGGSCLSYSACLHLWKV